MCSDKRRRDRKALPLVVLTLAEKGLVQLFVSKEVLLEIEDVLNRPEVRAYFPNLSDEIAGAASSAYEPSAILYPTFQGHSDTHVMKMMNLT
jgi:predicted nucleic acid-binding protein